MRSSKKRIYVLTEKKQLFIVRSLIQNPLAPTTKRLSQKSEFFFLGSQKWGKLPKNHLFAGRIDAFKLTAGYKVGSQKGAVYFSDSPFFILGVFPIEGQANPLAFLSS